MSDEWARGKAVLIYWPGKLFENEQEKEHRIKTIAGLKEAEKLAAYARKGGPVTVPIGTWIVGWAPGDALDAANAIRDRITELENGAE